MLFPNVDWLHPKHERDQKNFEIVNENFHDKLKQYHIVERTPMNYMNTFFTLIEIIYMVKQ